MTGISPELLRAWERRYRAVVPQRLGRRRMYSDQDIARLRLLRSAVGLGHSIGQASVMKDGPLRALLAKTEPGGLRGDAPVSRRRGGDPSSPLLDQVLDSIERLDYLACSRRLGRLGALLEPADLVYGLALPLMRQVGERWHGGTLSIAQEHMISALMRDLFGAVLRLHAPALGSVRILLATPSGDLHEFGILAAALLAAARGLSVVYLGPDLPGEEVAHAARRSSADAVVMGLSGGPASPAALGEIARARTLLPQGAELWVGPAAHAGGLSRLSKDRILLLEDLAAFESQLVRLSASKNDGVPLAASPPSAPGRGREGTSGPSLSASRRREPRA